MKRRNKTDRDCVEDQSQRVNGGECVERFEPLVLADALRLGRCPQPRSGENQSDMVLVNREPSRNTRKGK